MFLPAIEHDFCLNPTVTRSLSPFITPNVLASPFFISKSTITVISLTPLFLERGQGEVVVGRFRCFFFFYMCFACVEPWPKGAVVFWFARISLTCRFTLPSSPTSFLHMPFFGTPLQVQVFIMYCKRISLP